MLQDFPAETGVVRVKKEPPKLEGFYSEKARALDKLLALDKELAAKKALAAQKALDHKNGHISDGLHKSKLAINDGVRRSQVIAIDGLRTSQLALGRLRTSMTFAAPVVTVLAAIALAIVAIASWRSAPATSPSIQPVQETADIILPAAQDAQVSQPVASELPAQPEVSLSEVTEPKIPISTKDESARVAEMANPRQAEPARVSVAGNFNEPQAVATSLQARLSAPVDEPAPAQLNQPPRISAALGTAPAIASRPIEVELPSERMEAAPIAVEQRPADPTPAIRDVIRRYEAAYARLDASAAKEIWPSLDERALARAFAGLASQTLTLDPCNINVTGSSAVASCRGFATYVGRVGNKMGQVQRRDWTFELGKSTGDWKIRSVRFK
jgi:hypothetical protein